MSRLSDERLQTIMNECDKYELVLAYDPVVLGPSYLQDMIARCRNYTNHVVTLLNEVRRSKMGLDMDMRRKKTSFKIAADEYLAKNMTVRALANIKDREAQINLMLKAEYREIIDIENDILDLDHVIEVVKFRHRELKDTMREIQTQRGLIRDDRETGSTYGDERPDRPGMNAEDAEAAFSPGGRTRSEKTDEAEIEKMILEGFDGTAEPTPEPKEDPVVTVVETPSEPPAEPVVEIVEVVEALVVVAPVEPVAVPVVDPKPSPQKDEADIRAFLDQTEEKQPESVQTPPAVTVDDDLTDLIANL